MTAWVAAAGLLVASLAPCAAVCLRGDPLARLAGLEMTGVVVALALVALAVASGRTSFVDLALASSVLAFGGGLVFARFLERWL